MKRLRFIVIAMVMFACLSVPAWPMKQKLLGAPAGATTSVSATRYVLLYSPKTLSSVEFTDVVPTAGTFRKLYVRLSGDPDSGGSANGYTFTVRTATGAGSMADTSLTVQILSSTSNFRNSDTSHEVTVSAGDRIDMSIVPTTPNPANAVRFSFIVEFESSTANETILLGDSMGSSIGTVTPIYIPVGGQQNPNATENQTYTIFPCAGTITQFYGRLVTAPGSGYTRTASLSCNGTGSCTGGTALNWANVSGNQNHSQDISISAGDVVDVAWTYTGGVSPASGSGFVGIIFKPTTDGQFVIPLSASAIVLQTSGTDYLPIASSDQTRDGTESDTVNIGWNDFAIIGVYGLLDVAPGNGAGTQSYTFSLRKDSGDPSSPFSFVISESATTGHNTTDTALTLAQWSLYDTKIVAAGTPTAGRFTASCIGSTSNAVISPGRGMLLGVMP